MAVVLTVKHSKRNSQSKTYSNESNYFLKLVLPLIQNDLLLSFLQVSMPKRVNQGARRIVTVLGIGGVIISYLTTAPDYIGLEPSLNIFNAVLLGIVLFFLWQLHRDLEEMDTTESPDESANEDGDISTDGGIRLSPKLRELQEETPEGGGALAGLIAGGALGLLGGPLGVVLGGITGGLIGNEAEYQQIVDRYQDELAKTAKDALYNEAVYAPRPYLIEDIDHNSNEDVYILEIVDSKDGRHEIKLDLNERRYIYEEV